MSEPAWWQRGAIYQIYPRSFADADGDGVGDLAGITAHLDHLAALGVEAIWLSPIFPSPMADFGYDVADYCDVDPVFGTLADLDELVARLPRARHQAGARLGPEPQLRPAPVVPGVALEPRQPQARLVRVARRRRTAGRPTTGTSVFKAVRPGVDATTRPRASSTCTRFMPEQPDLNWDNPEVVAAMHDVLRFWLDRGVDGLRLDAIAKIAKDPLLRDHAGASRRHDEDWESIHERLRGIRRGRSTNTTTG